MKTLKITPRGFVHIRHDKQLVSTGANAINENNLIAIICKRLAMKVNQVLAIQFLFESAILGTAPLTNFDNTDNLIIFDAVSTPDLFTGDYDEIKLIDDLDQVIASYTPNTPLTKLEGVAVAVSWEIQLTA